MIGNDIFQGIELREEVTRYGNNLIERAIVFYEKVYKMCECLSFDDFDKNIELSGRWAEGYHMLMEYEAMCNNIDAENTDYLDLKEDFFVYFNVFREIFNILGGVAHITKKMYVNNNRGLPMLKMYYEKEFYTVDYYKYARNNKGKVEVSFNKYDWNNIERYLSVLYAKYTNIKEELENLQKKEGSRVTDDYYFLMSYLCGKINFIILQFSDIEKEVNIEGDIHAKEKVTKYNGKCKEVNQYWLSLYDKYKSKAYFGNSYTAD